MLTAHAIEIKAHLLQCRERGETRDPGADLAHAVRAQSGRENRAGQQRASDARLPSSPLAIEPELSRTRHKTQTPGPPAPASARYEQEVGSGQGRMHSRQSL